MRLLVRKKRCILSQKIKQNFLITIMCFIYIKAPLKLLKKKVRFGPKISCPEFKSGFILAFAMCRFKKERKN